MSARSIALETAAAGLLATAAALLVFGPIWTSMGAPLGTGDMYATYVNAEAFGGFGYTTTTQFGFPLGMNLNYAPNLDLTQNAFAHAVNLLTGSPFWGINLLLFVSFPVVAMLAYLTLRLVDGRGPLAIALAVAFAMIPFHFGRGLGHTYLATMYSAVTALALALVIGQGRLSRIASLRRRSRRVLAWIAVACLVTVTAWSGLYYAAFALILGVAAVLWRVAAGDRWRHVLLACSPVAAVGVLAVAGFLPGLLTTLSAPPSEQIGVRTPYESVTFAGNLAMALTPAPISELPGMWRYDGAVRTAFASAPPLENATLTNHGTWITTLCAVVFVAGLVVLARRRTLRETSAPLVAFLTVVAVAFFVPWGLNFVVASVVTPQVRAWNRLLPILLLLFVSGAVAVLGRTRLNRWTGTGALTGALLLAVVVVEQVLPFRPAYAQGAAAGSTAVADAQTYSRELNAAIPSDCGVLQLPYVVYPEQGSIEDLGDYEHFLLALVNPGKDFSYGAVRGTQATGPVADIGNRIPPPVADRLAAAGFCAIHVDRRGFTDPAWTWVNSGLREQFGPPVATGADGGWRAYTLRPGARP